jgi:hypothetical protein
MLSVCLCRLPGLIALRQLPSVYRHLTSADQAQIQEAAWQCDSDSTAFAYIPPGRAVVEGKGGREIIRQRSNMSDRSVDMYEARIFDKARKDDAVASLKSRGFHTVVTTQNFILTGNIGESALKSTGELMENVLGSFVSQFGFARPRTLITVYLYEDKQAMMEHAWEQHSVTIPSSMWAYTFPLDASITIWRSGGLGTVGHEVFHALLDQNAPYAPPWLNEGAAALFEEFRLTSDGRIEGTFRLDHWRVPYLHSAQHISLKQLLGMDWAKFDDNRRLQQNHSMAKFFVMYLQHQQKLRGVLSEYIRHDLFDGSKTDAILVNQLGKDLNQIASEFEQWLLAKVPPLPNVLDSISLSNSARQIDNNTYKWTAYIQGSNQDLEQISYVTYYLHPTFKPNVRQGDASQKGHPLTANGWGVFELKAIVVLKDGQHREYKHMLKFQ